MCGRKRGEVALCMADVCRHWLDDCCVERHGWSSRRNVLWWWSGAGARWECGRRRVGLIYGREDRTISDLLPSRRPRNPHHVRIHTSARLPQGQLAITTAENEDERALDSGCKRNAGKCECWGARMWPDIVRISQIPDWWLSDPSVFLRNIPDIAHSYRDASYNVLSSTAWRDGENARC